MRGGSSSAAEHILEDATALLAGVESGGASLDDLLDSGLKYPELRRSVSNLAFAFFRRKRLIDGWIGRLAARPPRPRLRRVLEAVLTQICFQDGIAPQSAVNVAVEFVKRSGRSGEAKFLNAVLRRALAEPVVPGEAPEEVLPPAVLARWRSRGPGVLAGLTTAFLAPAEFTFRAARGFEPGSLACEERSGYGGFRFFRAADPAELLASEALRRGDIYIQDPATSFAVSLPDYSRANRVLDLCAAPGGKSLMMAERLPEGAMLLAADRSARRQRQTLDNFRRRGLAFPVVTALPTEIEGEFDLVLADVPCSNTGVFRRRPDALWRFNRGTLEKIVALQREILEAAAERVAPGGELVYSTCSIEPEENIGQITAFLEHHPEFSAGPSGQLLPTREADGAYACLLRRNSNSI